MNTMKFVSISLFLLLTACVSENIIDGEGYVFDAKTNQPLDSVVVKSYIKDEGTRHFKREMITDSTGFFMVQLA